MRDSAAAATPPQRRPAATNRAGETIGTLCALFPQLNLER
jgi:hypothetical protein